MLYHGRGQLDTITQAEIIAPHMAIREDLGLFAAGETMLEAVDKVAEEHERNVRLALLLLAGVRALETKPARPRRGRRVLHVEAALALRIPSRRSPRARSAARRTRSCSRAGHGRRRLSDAARRAASAPVSREALARLQQLAVVNLNDAGDVVDADPRGPQGVARAALRVRGVLPGAADAARSRCSRGPRREQLPARHRSRTRPGARRDRDGRQRPVGARSAVCSGPRATRPARRRSPTRSKGGVEVGLKWLTVYAFSTENWRRPRRRGPLPDELQPRSCFGAAATGSTS